MYEVLVLKAKAMPLRSRARPITVLRTSSELYPPGEEGLVRVAGVRLFRSQKDNSPTAVIFRTVWVLVLVF